MALRRSRSSPSRGPLSSMRVSKPDLLFSSVLVNVALPLRSSASFASRLEMVFDRSDSPVAALRTCGGEFSKVSEMVSKLSASRRVSMSSTVPLRSWNACVTSYGEVVRVSGMRLPGSWRPEPSGSRARYLSPRTVLMAMAAVVRSPSQASSTSKVTFTLAPSSATPVTLPTLTPAMRTSSPSPSPAASEKSAL